MDIELQFRILGEMVLAMVLGGLIGIEREYAQKPAGFRTHMLVSGSAAFLVGLSSALVEAYASDTFQGRVNADPIRTVEAIITGISFLGMGTIFKREKDSTVEGLTTAASILFSAAIGIAVAAQQLVLAVGGTVLVLLVLHVLRSIEKRIVPEKKKEEDISEKRVSPLIGEHLRHDV
jgi:putative Mg2+ transporter-C (MgtC) family protein